MCLCYNKYVKKQSFPKRVKEKKKKQEVSSIFFNEKSKLFMMFCEMSL